MAMELFAMDVNVQESEENVKEISRNELYSYIKECSERSLDAKIIFMEYRLANITHCPEEKVSELRRKLRYFKSKFKKKWAAASNKEERFRRNKEKWLAGTIKLTTWSKQKRSRPSKKFEGCSERSKRRKTKELREKVLVHGPTIIQHVLVPIGQLSEEAAESPNKHFRQYRQNFGRKFSRISCNIDVINRLLLTSDPLISCERPLERNKKRKPFFKEALEFLLPMEDCYFSLQNENRPNHADDSTSSEEDDTCSED